MTITSTASILNLTKVNNVLPFEVSDSPELSVETHILCNDPLVLSCTLYRITILEPTTETGYFRACGLSSNSKEIAKHVIQRDYELAEEIKNDFGQRLTYFSLVVGPLTKYKQDLYYFLTANFKQSDGSYKVPDKYLAMAYKLPHFYFYNKGQLDFFDDLKKTVNKGDSLSGTVKVKYLGKLVPSTRRSKNITEYWFVDEAGNKVVTEIPSNNPLTALIEHLADTTFSLEAKLFKRTNYSVEYYMAKNWKFS